MKQPWCLAASDPEAKTAMLIHHYVRRWTTEPQFHDTKDLRFGIGLSAAHVGEPARRHRPLLVRAFAIALLGEVGERVGVDRLLKSNTSNTRTHSLFRLGCMLCELIPRMPEHRLGPLIAAFAQAVDRGREFSGLLAQVK